MVCRLLRIHVHKHDHGFAIDNNSYAADCTKVNLVVANMIENPLCDRICHLINIVPLVSIITLDRNKSGSHCTRNFRQSLLFVRSLLHDLIVSIGFFFCRDCEQPVCKIVQTPSTPNVLDVNLHSLRISIPLSQNSHISGILTQTLTIIPISLVVYAGGSVYFSRPLLTWK